MPSRAAAQQTRPAWALPVSSLSRGCLRRKDGDIGIITLNAPERMNTLGGDLLPLLNRYCLEVSTAILTANVPIDVSLPERETPSDRLLVFSGRRRPGGDVCHPDRGG